MMSHQKAAQLQKFMTLSGAKRAWGKDQKLLRCNLLLVPTNINYTVLLAMGRKKSALSGAVTPESQIFAAPQSQIKRLATSLKEVLTAEA